MKRYPDWDKRLSKYINEMLHVPFEWGTNDCVLFAAKGIEALTGENLYGHYPKYTTEFGARRIIQEAGGLQQLIDRNLPNVYTSYLQAKRGDLVLVKHNGMEHIGLVCDCGMKIAAPSDHGLTFYILSKAVRGWTYG